jgi:hypothetical protein
MKEGTLLVVRSLERLFLSLRAGCLFWWPLLLAGCTGGESEWASFLTESHKWRFW